MQVAEGRTTFKHAFNPQDEHCGTVLFAGWNGAGRQLLPVYGVTVPSAQHNNLFVCCSGNSFAQL
jgi:hypothetical protein